MPEIVLTTLNARYSHCSFGLRYLMANLGDLRPRSVLIEFDINQSPLDIAERLLDSRPRIIGFGVYVWNVSPTTAVIRALKRVQPEIIVIIGGPEVSFELDDQEIARLADHIITGEADLEFARVCAELLNGRKPREQVIASALPGLDRLALPYDCYTGEDIAHRIIYVEASRGCPFHCEFCLSSLELPVRQFPLDAFLGKLESLLQRGVLQFKFVDRTFNLNLTVSRRILEFFLARLRPGLFVHFEMIPDRLPGQLREIIVRFPPGVLQFEVGIQSFNPEVCARISRRQDFGRIEDNLRFLRNQTGVHIHADLIVGLPGESVESFGAGFDRLIGLGPQEIQIGLLKRLRGTPIVRHDSEWAMIYSPDPPYEILQNRQIEFATMRRLRRFSRAWDLVANSGNFIETLPLIWDSSSSPFREFLQWSDWLHTRVGPLHGIALDRLARCLFEFLTRRSGPSAGEAASRLRRDYERSGRAGVPGFLLGQLSPEVRLPPRGRKRSGLKRQARRMVADVGNETDADRRNESDGKAG